MHATFYVYVCEKCRLFLPSSCFLIDIDTVGMIRRQTRTSQLINITICAYEFMKKKNRLTGVAKTTLFISDLHNGFMDQCINNIAF